MSATLSAAHWDRLLAVLNNEAAHGCDCHTCYNGLDELAEAIQAGKPVEELMPYVHAHVRCCPPCQQHLDALLACMEASGSGAE